MADGDKHVSLAGLKAVYDHLNNNANDLKSALDDMSGYQITDIDITDGTLEHVLIAQSTGLWQYNADRNDSRFLDVSSLKPYRNTKSKIIITANKTTGALFTILKTDSHENGTAPDYATGFGREYISAGETREFFVPDDGNYLWVHTRIASAVYTPTSIQQAQITVIPVIDDTLTQPMNAADAKTTGDRIAQIENGLTQATTIDFTAANTIPGLISSDSGNWVVRDNYVSYYMDIIPGAAKSIAVTANSNAAAVVGIVKSSPVDGKAPNYATGCGRTTIAAGTTQTIAIPDDAHHIIILKQATNNNTPASAIIYGDTYVSYNNAEQAAHRRITYAIPPSEGHLNVVRRARQLTDIKWTPAVNIPRISQMANDISTSYPFFEDVFSAGTEYTGVPYGQATKGRSDWGKYGGVGFKVGLGVGIETFVSAVETAGSVVSEESEYDSTNSHTASYYATICNGLCDYAYAFDTYYNTDEIASAGGTMSKIGDVETIDMALVEMGDMLWASGHAAVITDIIADDSGVQYIEISEATTIGNDDWNRQGSQYGGLCRRKFHKVSEMRTNKWRTYGVYRYANIESVPYTRSPYVDTGDEGLTNAVRNFPVVPYMGENFVYVAGKIKNSKILTPAYKPGMLTKLRVTKDGQNWNSDGNGGYYDVTGNYVTVGFADAGEYSAYLCEVVDGTETVRTRACHWTVVSGS